MPPTEADASRSRWFRSWGYHAEFYAQTWRGSVASSVLFPILYLAVARHRRRSPRLPPHRTRGRSDLSALHRAKFARHHHDAVGRRRVALAGPRRRQMDSHLSRRGDDAAGTGRHPLRQTRVGGHESVRRRRSFYTIIIGCFGALQSWWCLTLPFIGTLVTLAFSAPLVAYAARSQSDASFTTLYRFAFVPMFLFSATFYPLSAYPGYLRPVVQFFPLYHGVALARAAAFGQGSLAGASSPRGSPRGDGRRRHCLGSTHDATTVDRLMLARTLPMIGSRRSLRVLERNALVYRAQWVMLISGFFEPLFYLLSIGIGLNKLVGPAARARQFHQLRQRSWRRGCWPPRR